MDFQNYASRHKRWSEKTFGSVQKVGTRTEGILKHIEKEVNEVRKGLEEMEQIRQKKGGLRADNFQEFRQKELETIGEFVDIIILSIDAMWRMGASPREIEEMLAKKQIVNFQRKWDTNVSSGEPTEHIRENEND